MLHVASQQTYLGELSYQGPGVVAVDSTRGEAALIAVLSREELRLGRGIDLARMVSFLPPASGNLHLDCQRQCLPTSGMYVVLLVFWNTGHDDASFAALSRARTCDRTRRGGGPQLSTLSLATTCCQKFLEPQHNWKALRGQGHGRTLQHAYNAGQQDF